MYLANFSVNQPSVEVNLQMVQNSATADLILNVTPDRTSMLINDSEYITKDVNDLSNYMLTTDIITALNQKVDKVSGKGLSTNDFTNADKTKLEGIEVGAQVNKVNSVNGQVGDVTITTPTKTSDLTNDSNFATVSQIPTNNNQLVNGARYITTASLPTKLSDLSNDTGFITNSVNNLTNYYLKTETYTKQEVNQLIADIPKFKVQIVQALPQTGEAMVLYLVPKVSTAPDIYDEYIWIETSESFELIGTTAVDLTGYATEQWVQNQGYITGITSSDVTSALGYTPYNSSNPNGYITLSALSGYATESFVTSQGYITGISSTMVTNALGYTPYSVANPNNYTSVVESTVSGWGFTKNTGTVTSVNNVSPVNGDVTVYAMVIEDFTV